MVIAKLCHWLIIGICQDHLGALVVYLSNWGELVVADNGANLMEQLARNFIAAIDRLSQFCVDFGTASLARDLDMPAIIISSGAAAEGDLSVGEAEVFSVVVDGRKCVVARVCDVVNSLKAGQFRELSGLGYGEFRFNFEKRLCRHSRTFYFLDLINLIGDLTCNDLVAVPYSAPVR